MRDLRPVPPVDPAVASAWGLLSLVPVSENVETRYRIIGMVSPTVAERRFNWDRARATVLCVCTVSDASRNCASDSNCSAVGGNRVDGPFRLPLCRVISRRYLRMQNICQKRLHEHLSHLRDVLRLTSVPDGPRSKTITPPKILASAQ